MGLSWCPAASLLAGGTQRAQWRRRPRRGIYLRPAKPLPEASGWRAGQRCTPAGFTFTDALSLEDRGLPSQAGPQQHSYLEPLLSITCLGLSRTGQVQAQVLPTRCQNTSCDLAQGCSCCPREAHVGRGHVMRCQATHTPSPPGTRFGLQKPQSPPPGQTEWGQFQEGSSLWPFQGHGTLPACSEWTPGHLHLQGQNANPPSV